MRNIRQLPPEELASALRDRAGKIYVSDPNTAHYLELAAKYIDAKEKPKKRRSARLKYL